MLMTLYLYVGDNSSSLSAVLQGFNVMMCGTQNSVLHTINLYSWVCAHGSVLTAAAKFAFKINLGQS